MEFATVKEWLDAIVENIEEQHRLKNFNADISTFNPDDFVFINGIEMVADLMGIKLIEEYDENAETLNYKYHFVYRGIKFQNYYTKRLESFNHDATN